MISPQSSPQRQEKRISGSTIVTEERFQCVQCDKSYIEIQNHAHACSFHQLPNDEYNGRSCCGKLEPCEFRFHRHYHHNEYKYELFLNRLQNIMEYSDSSHIPFCTLEDVPFENEEIAIVKIGELVSWGMLGNKLPEPHLYIQVGGANDSANGQNYFRVFPVSDLKLLAKSNSRKGSIFRKSRDGFLADAQWVVHESGDIVGVKATVKAVTSPVCTVETILFNPETLELVSKTRIMEPKHSFKPETTYILPKKEMVGRELPQPPVRSTRKDFKTTGPLRDHFIITLVTELLPNQYKISGKIDYFTGTLSIFNKSRRPIVLKSISAEYRLIGKDYQPLDFLEVGLKKPTTIESLKGIEVKFEIGVFRTKLDQKLNVLMSDAALVARDRPLRVKFTASDIEDRTCFFVAEYVFNHQIEFSKRVDDLAVIFVDDYERFERYGVHIRMHNDVLEVSGFDLKFKEYDFNKLVYQSIKNNISEYPVLKNKKIAEGINGDIYALVDKNCNRVYALKVLLVSDRGACGTLDYFPVPIYGNNNETKSISYAEENARLPFAICPPSVQHPIDDDLDDKTEIVDPIAPLLADLDALERPLSDTDKVYLETLRAIAAPNTIIEKRLQSIDDNLERTASAIENLTAFLKTIALQMSRDQ